MPTYQYACRSCDHRFEAVQGFHEAALQVCPECEADDVRKLFGSVGVVFKGSGFYRNDSRNEAKSGKSGSSGKTGTKTGTGDSAAAAPAATPAKSEPKPTAPAASSTPASS